MNVACQRAFKSAFTALAVALLAVLIIGDASSKQYVRVRAYYKVGSTYCYAAWSPVKSFG